METILDCVHVVFFIIATLLIPLVKSIIEAHAKQEILLEEQLKQNMNALRKGTEITAKEITDAITEKEKAVSISNYTLPKQDYCIVHRTNCPNCGAPLNTHRKCEHCGTIVPETCSERKKPDTLICEHGSDGFDELKLYADDKVIVRTVIDRLNGIGWS